MHMHMTARRHTRCMAVIHTYARARARLLLALDSPALLLDCLFPLDAHWLPRTMRLRMHGSGLRVRCQLLLRRVRDAAHFRRLWRVQLLQLEHRRGREGSSPALVFCPPPGEVLLVHVAVAESLKGGSRRARIEPRRECQHGKSAVGSSSGRRRSDHATEGPDAHDSSIGGSVDFPDVQRPKFIVVTVDGQVSK